MADQQDKPTGISGLVSKVTVKALQEFDSDDIQPENGAPQDDGTAERPSSRPPSGKPGSRPSSSKPASNKGSRPASGTPKPASDHSAQSARSPKDKPSSARARSSSRERPASGGTARSQSGSRPGSAVRSRPTSAAKEGPEDGFAVTGSRPASASRSVDKSQPSSRPQSGRSAANRASPQGKDRPASGQRASGGSPTGRPTSGRSRDGRPTSGQDPTDQAAGSWALQPHVPPQAGDDLDMPQQTTVYDRDPDDSGSDDNDEEEEEFDDDDADSDESEGENEMVVLDPDHPLMQRFQRALKTHLDKQNEKVTLELKELLEAVRNKKKDREDLGVELYGVQQELARHQMMLEKFHDQYGGVKQERLQHDKHLEDVRKMYKDEATTVMNERKKGAELMQEVENIGMRIYYMDSAKEEVRSDIAVMRRAAEKADAEVGKAETRKQKQDLFVDRLVERVDKFREEIAMYETQLAAQSEETKATKEALTEAHMEIEGINLEKKQLFQQWNSSLIGMRRRDEAHSAMQEALREQQQRILTLETEFDGYKRNIQKEQEQNEKLTLVLNKTDGDIATVRKLLTQCQARHEALKNEYATYTRMLHETEQALNRATTDKTLRQNEVAALRKQIEREYLERVRLEDEILEKMRSQLTMDKASKYTTKLTGKLRDRTKDLEAQVAQAENQISRDTLETSHTRSRIERLQQIMDELDNEVGERNQIISRSEAEIVKRNAIIERKQGVIDQYNKRLEQMIQSAGGVEVGPLEIQINSLQKSIDAEIQEILELQQMWLRDQSELVRLAKEKSNQSGDVENLKKQLTILSQKKLRIEGEINHEHKETGDIERSIRHYQHDMVKLNTLLHNERGMEHELEQSNILKESDFISALRDAERQSIEMQSKLDAIKEEKERLLNSLVEAERQIMLWEKKTQLARETRAAVDSEVGQGEVRAMKAEIHRMQVRYTQLMKQQERMIQEMEKAVSRRDTIVTRGDAQAKMNKKVMTKGTFQRQMGELKKKIKSTVQDAGHCDSEIRQLRDHQGDLSKQLEERQLNVQQLQSQTDNLDGDVERLVEQKQRNLNDLISRQQKSKCYQQLKDGRYTRLCKTDAALDTELQKQIDRMQTLNAIVDRLNQEFPHAQPALRKASLALGAKTNPED